MAPNVISSENRPEIKVNLGRQKERKEIFYDGYYYDVTDFINRHPGGRVIHFYTEKGEDATQAIEQFHYRSKEKVEAILRTFKKRRVEPNEQEVERKVLTRHEALSADFRKLFLELQIEGYFEPSIRHVILRLLECVSLAFLGFGIFFQCDAIFGKLLSCIVIGFCMSRHAYMQHEGGHNSLTGNPRIDKIIQNYVMCFMLGGSSKWWNSQHNRHHAMPQRLEHDVDLATLPYVAFNKRAVKDKKEINSFFIRYQAVLYWTLDLLVVTIAWKFVLHPRYQLRKRAYVEMLLDVPSFILMFYMGIGYFFVWFYWFTFFLSINFALSHSHLDVADKPTHWIEYSLTHTINITPSILVDYWMGYLNYQVEHHLFPTMPQFCQKEISHRVKALAQKHGLPYRVYSYPEACMSALKNLNDVGKELNGDDKLGNGLCVHQ